VYLIVNGIGETVTGWLTGSRASTRSSRELAGGETGGSARIRGAT
jgi:hypothetical protein